LASSKYFATNNEISLTLLPTLKKALLQVQPEDSVLFIDTEKRSLKMKSLHAYSYLLRLKTLNEVL
jgi:hypothetical protein